MRKIQIACLLLMTTLLVMVGCSEDEENPLVPDDELNLPDSSLPFPDTPDQLLANFRTIYETRDADEYRLILDPAFVTLLQQDTIIDFPLVGDELDMAEEFRIHDRLFLGEVLQDANGNLLPPIVTFSFSRLTKIVDWGLSLPTDPIPSTLSALYDVEILADRGQSYSTYIIRGQIRFYGTTAEVILDGQPQSYFRLVGQLDLTDNNKDAQNVTWGSLKALFH